MVTLHSWSEGARGQGGKGGGQAAWMDAHLAQLSEWNLQPVPYSLHSLQRSPTVPNPTQATLTDTPSVKTVQQPYITIRHPHNPTHPVV